MSYDKLEDAFARQYEYDLTAAKSRIAELEAENDALKQELASVLSDWNDLVQASGARSNGGAIGFVRAMRAERDALKAALIKIASYGEGDIVNSSFDEPYSAQTARDAFKNDLPAL